MGFFSKKGKRSRENRENEFFSFIDQENEDEQSDSVVTDTKTEDEKAPEVIRPSHALTPEEVASPDEPPKREYSPEDSSALSHTPKDKTAPDEESHHMLDRVRAYTIDEDGHDAAESTDPVYRLESVAEIIKRRNSDAISKISRKYDILIDDLGKKAEPEEKVEEPKKNELPPPTASKETEVSEDEQIKVYPKGKKRTKAFEQMVSDASERDPSQYVFEELFPGVEPLTSADLSPELPDISDIDTRTAERAEPKTATAETATIRFTPIKPDGSGKPQISVSSTTRPIDITGEFGVVPEEEKEEPMETRLEENEFEAFSPTDEYTSPKDAKKLIRTFSLKKRSAFLRTVFTGFITLMLALFALPPLSELFVAHAFVCACICEGAMLAAVLINLDMFTALKDVIGKRCKSDALAILSSLGALLLGLIAMLNPSDVSKLLTLASIVLFSRALSGFWRFSTLLSNLKQITSPTPKKAATLISDHATTFAMAKNAVEGDALVAAGRKTNFISDYMKYSSFSVELGGKIRIVFFASLAFSIVLGLVCGSYFGNALSGFEAAASVLCMVAAPALFFTETLPLMTAASKLNKKGAMIAGKAGAQKLELANAAVLSSGDIFPDGTITMHSMKVLAANDIDNTIMRAASLTEALGSTLAPIFKRIAGTNSSYVMPDSDTVKYEERLGLSGWVDNELLFIGNRTLMEAHGIAVPSIELDRKILRQGYFPVYLASGDTACALIIIQYNVDPNVAKELRRLTGLGVTLLVNNCDPNINEEMICDYIGLYEDSVKIMSNAGVHMYQSAVTNATSCSAPAAYRSSNMTFISLLNCASRIKRSSLLLTVCYILTACLGTVVFVYAAFAGATSLPSGAMVLLYELIATAVSIILFTIQKP